MIAYFISLIYDVFDSIFDWCVQAYNSFGLSFVGLALAVILIGGLSRYILKPFIGGSVSDGARSVRKSVKGSKSNANNS